MFNLTNFIPQVATVKIALIVGAVAALFLGGLYCGYQIGAKALPEAQKALAIDLAIKTTERAAVSQEVITKYVDRIQTVREEARVIIQEVPQYVPNDCVLPDSVRVFHNAATQGHLPIPPSSPDAPRSSPKGTPRLW